MLGFILFVNLSCFLCLYLVAFSHKVQMELQEQWMLSSGAALAIDLIAFEILPAFFFGGVGLVVVGGHCKCCLCSLLFLDVYRAFRNLAA